MCSAIPFIFLPCAHFKSFFWFYFNCSFRAPTLRFCSLLCKCFPHLFPNSWFARTLTFTYALQLSAWCCDSSSNKVVFGEDGASWGVWCDSFQFLLWTLALFILRQTQCCHQNYYFHDPVCWCSGAHNVLGTHRIPESPFSSWEKGALGKNSCMNSSSSLGKKPSKISSWSSLNASGASPSWNWASWLVVKPMERICSGMRQERLPKQIPAYCLANS